MKNLFKNLMLVAVAAMGFTACEQVIDDVNVTNETFKVNIVGEFADDTRSGFLEKAEGATAYKSAWDGKETVRFAIIPDTFGDSDKATYVDEENESKGDRATFAPTFDSNEGTIHAFSPKGVYDKNDASACKGGFTSDAIALRFYNAYVVVPAEQTTTAISVDPAAHILAGKADFAENVNMTFNHVVAYGKMTITNFAGAIDKVEVTASESLAGISCKYYYADSGENSAGELVGANVDTITINNLDEAKDNKVFWFGCAPADLTDTTLKVKIYSGEDTYTRDVVINKTLKFQQGRVASFSVSMEGIAADVKEEVVPGDWIDNAYNLVKSAAHLEVDDKVIIVAKGYDVAMSTTQNNNNRGQVGVTKIGDVITFGSDVQILTLEAGTKAGTFAFNTGNGYLYAASSSSNNLKTQKTNNDNGSWSITIANDGTATIIAQGTYTHNVMQYNQSSSLFACYASATQKAVSIYKLVGEYTPTVPAISYTVANVSVAHDAISGEAAVEATNGDGWDFSATADAAWVSALECTVSKISFVVVPNDTEESRVATVNVTATKEGYDDVVTTFTITQGAKPSGGDGTEGGDGPTYTSYTENFTTWTENSTDKTVTGSKEGNACTWSYVGASKQYWSNISSGSSLSFAITLLKPASDNATYVLSEKLSGGIKNLKLTARSNNANTGVNVYVIDLATGTTHKIGTLNTTSKKADFTGTYDLSNLNITGDYQIKIANKSTAAYCCIGGLSWNY